MPDQPELDLPAPATPAPVIEDRARRGFAGFTRLQIAVGALMLGAAIWMMWVTHAVTAPQQDHIVSARLSAIVGEYVEAQRFSGSPPDRMKSEMQAFMASLDRELQRRGAAGQVVLVGEAVLTKNVPDITDNLKRAVFASGVPEPKRASLEDLRRMQQQQLAILAQQPRPTGASPSAAGAAVTIDPMAAVPPSSPLVIQPNAQAAPAPYAPPAASVATFGGTDDGSMR